ncbi:MAG: SPOCS domain-containing protein [Cellulosilyticaceae bacterium]
MVEQTKRFIKYEGISIPQEEDLMQYGTKIGMLEGVGYLMDKNYHAQDIIKCKAEVDIQHYEVIDTPRGTSVEGQHLTGKRMLIVGDLKLRVEYLNTHIESQVQTARFRKPFSEYIILPAQTNLLPYMYPTIYILDSYIKLLDDKRFFYNVMILCGTKVY